MAQSAHPATPLLAQAIVLNALSKLPSAALPLLERETGFSVEQLESALEFLLLQGLVEQDESNSESQLLEGETGMKKQKSLNLPASSTASGPVECLGHQFESDAARRDHFIALLREKTRDPSFPSDRRISGGEDEDILRLSDPPYYTACPNPFLTELVAHYGKAYQAGDTYHRDPFAIDVSVGKTDALYKAHSYHTKVPHLAIVPSILHYTKPGEIVLDGFCGSGMTGVAALWCGAAPDAYRKEVESEWKREGLSAPNGAPAKPC